MSDIFPYPPRENTSRILYNGPSAIASFLLTTIIPAVTVGKDMDQWPAWRLANTDELEDPALRQWAVDFLTTGFGADHTVYTFLENVAKYLDFMILCAFEKYITEDHLTELFRNKVVANLRELFEKSRFFLDLFMPILPGNYEFYTDEDGIMQLRVFDSSFTPSDFSDNFVYSSIRKCLMDAAMDLPDEGKKLGLI